MSMTFTKLFSSITESTIWCEDSETRVVWITMLAMADKNGRVWASIPGLANRARVPIEKCEDALNKFFSPDSYSRTPDFEGRRIELIDGGWRLLNHNKYRSIRDDEERREYKKNWIADKRKSEKPPSSVDNVDRSRPQYTHTEAEAYTEADKKEKKKGRFAPPSLDEVRGYCIERKNNINPESFVDHYASNGWKVGKNQMKDWQAAVRTWEKRNETNKPNNQADTRSRAKRLSDELDDIARKDVIKNGFAAHLD